MDVDDLRKSLDGISIEDPVNSPEVFLVDDEGREYPIRSVYKENGKVFLSMHSTVD